jgi:hypothetical protein
MPTQEQAQAQNLDWLNSTGGSNDVRVNMSLTGGILIKYGATLLQKLNENIKKKDITASGTLLNSIRIEEIKSGEDVIGIQIKLINYFSYVDKGVKGVKSSSNAPNSPYQYKNYAMSDKGRKSIKKYIQSGKAKFSATDTRKYGAIGGERKGASFNPKKSLIDSQVDRMIYMIKRFGIKKTNFFTDAWNDTFKDIESTLAQTIGNDIAINITRL